MAKFLLPLAYDPQNQMMYSILIIFFSYFIVGEIRIRLIFGLME
jgi:hypothetical protein